MRFVILIVGATALGAALAGVIQAVYPQSAETFAAVRTLRGDLSDFRISDLNPIGLVYRYVVQQVTSGEPRIAFRQEPVVWPAFKPIDLNSGFKIDQREIQRMVGADLSRQIQDNTRRMQDMSAYMRNPAGWHGMPPH